MSPRVSIIDSDAIDQLRAELRIEPGLVRRLRIAYFKHFRGESAALAELPEAARGPFAERVDFHPLTLHKRCDSQVDGASKLIFRTAGGMLIESVLLRAGTGRVALCLSSQVGCAAACGFCATGKMGMAHDLSAAEIVDQVVQANEQLRLDHPGGGPTVRNLVFMGMGEPFHNEAAVHRAIETLTDPALLHHPPSRILVSTVGVTDAMLRFGERLPGVNVALSLHSVRQATREAIIPLARKYPLDELRATLVELQRVQRRQVMIEYLMLAGVNDSDGDARTLIDWLDGLRVHVNLIPYNPVEHAAHLASSPRERLEAFGANLRAADFQTTIRYSLGRDIDAACGQLVQAENRRIAQSGRPLEAMRT